MDQLIICPSKAKSVILTKLRKENPLSDIKILSKEEVINAQFGRFINEDAVVKHLIKERDCSYGYANHLLKVLPRINAENAKTDNLKKLLKIKDECVNLFSFKVDESLIQLICGQKCTILYYANDVNLNKVLDDLNIKYKYEFIKDAELPIINKFDNQNEELLYVFSKIADLIVNHGVSSNKIKLFNIGEFNKLDLDRISNNFGININYHNNISYFSHPITIQFIKLYEEGLEIDEINTKLCEFFNDQTDFISELCKLASDYLLFEDNRQKQLSIFKEIFNKLSIRDPLFLDAVNVTKSMIINDDEYLFILNFSEKTCPSTITTNDFLSNKEKELLNLSSDEYLNKLNKDEFVKFLQQNPNIFVSYSSKIGNDDNLISPLKDELNLKVEHHSVNQNFYSETEFDRSFGVLKDYKNKYSLAPNGLSSFNSSSKDIPSDYLTYSNSFKPFSVPELYPSLSFSRIDMYNNCPFKYYVARVLNLNDFSENVFSQIGNFIHSILEDIDGNKDFDTIFSSIFESNNYDLIEPIYLPRLRHDFEIVYERVCKFHQDIQLPHKFYDEQSLSVSLDTFTVTGRADSIITFGDSDENIVLIDYKFKSDTVKIDEKEFELGINLQLPTYAFLSHYGSTFSDKNVVGTYFFNLKGKNELQSHDKLFADIKLDGISLDNFELMNEFAPGFSSSSTTDCDTPPVLSPGRKSKKNPNLPYSKCRSSEWFDDKIELTKNTYKETFNKISNNSFEISPLFLNFSKLACSKCSYKDICYVKKEDFREVITDDEDSEEETDNG